MTTSERPSDKTLSSAIEITKTVSQIAGALVSLSALGFFIGWREASSYFDALGAPWAASSLSATMLLQSSSGIIVIFAISAYIAVITLVNGNASPRGLGWAAAICLALSFMLFLSILFEAIGFSAKTIYGLATGAALLFSVAAGLTLAELIARYRDADSRFLPSHLWLVFWVISYGLIQAPTKLGQARAEYHLDMKSEELPVVSPIGTSSTEVWKLVYVVDGKALVILTSPMREKTIFRLIEVKELQSIKTTLSAKK